MQKDFRAKSHKRGRETFAARSTVTGRGRSALKPQGHWLVQRWLHTASRTNRGVHGCGRLCAWELLKAERIRREKATAVKKGTERAFAIIRSVGCHGRFSFKCAFIQKRQPQTYFLLKDVQPIRWRFRFKQDNWDVRFCENAGIYFRRS